MADKQDKRSENDRDKRAMILAAATGIGSAAIVAGLLYATRGKGKSKPAAAVPEATD